MTARSWHVAVVVENLPLGVDTRLRKQVDDLLDAGYAVTVVTRRHEDNAAHRHREGLRLLEHQPPPEGRGILGFAVEYAVALVRGTTCLLRLRAEGPIDVLQVCQPPDVYFPVAWVLRALGARVVVDQRDLMPEVLASRGGRPPRPLVWLLHLLERGTRGVAHHIVTVNDYLRERLAGDTHHPQVSVVRNGPVLARADAVACDPALREGGPLLVWAGKIGRQDRVDLVVRLADEIVHTRGRTDCRFVVLGDGECLDEVRELAGALGLSPWVRFTGWTEEREVFRHLASADVGLDTSMQNEVTPVKAMEYFAFGLPLACFDVTESRRLARDAALFAPPGDVTDLATNVLTLVDDTALRLTLGRAGRRLIEDELAWERQRAAYLAAVGPPADVPSRVSRPGAGAPPVRRAR
jgi:glycosyltransferase involved in cell wall biosynthesis